MREGTKKGIGKLKIGLVISAIVIVALAGLNIWFYVNKTSLESQLKERWDSWGSELWWHSYYQNMSNQLSTEKDVLQSAYNDYMATHSYTNSEYDNYVATHSHTNTEYDALKSERDTLRTPKLIKVAWNEVDVHSGNWHLHVWGAVVNVGTDTAYNCKMHVVCYQGAVIGLDTYVLLYTIAGETSKWVDENLYYAYGSGLTGWSVTLQWTATP